jgi:hypothetical protein
VTSSCQWLSAAVPTRGSTTAIGGGDISELTALVKTRLRRMQYRPGLLDGFLACTRLDLTLSGSPIRESR